MESPLQSCISCDLFDLSSPVILEGSLCWLDIRQPSMAHHTYGLQTESLSHSTSCVYALCRPSFVLQPTKHVYMPRHTWGTYLKLYEAVRAAVKGNTIATSAIPTPHMCQLCVCKSSASISVACLQVACCCDGEFACCRACLATHMLVGLLGTLP